ncbi:MAG: Ig-like domain-containing protein, partial [Propionibacteriaceae bacterium]|nr:Ig-like domain-containing protein [Propionibacteriaceae bacterium]
ISGSPVVGQLLAATVGSYDAADVSTQVQWLKDGSPIPGEVNATYRIAAADAGHAISAKISANKAGYTSVSTMVGPVAVSALPTDVLVPPVIAAPGDGKVGTLLTASGGSYTAAGATLAYQWTADGVPIAGAVSNSLTVKAEYAGQLLACAVTVTAPGYERLQISTAPYEVRSANQSASGKTTATVKLAASKKSVKYGVKVKFTATVSTGTGKVVFKAGGAELGTAKVVDKAAVLNVPLPDLGTAKVTAEYGGDDTTEAAASNSVTVKVAKAAPASIKVEALAFKKNTKPKVTVTVGKMPSGKYAEGTIKVYVGGKAVASYKTQVSWNGVKTLVLPKKYAKSIKVKAKFTPADTAHFDSVTSKTVTAKAK